MVKNYVVNVTKFCPKLCVRVCPN